MIADRIRSIQAVSGGGGGGGATDVNYAYRTLILNMQGTAGTAIFTDSSPNAFTVTPNGDIQLASDVTLGTAASLDGNGDYLNLGGQADFAFGSGDWTVETWIKPSVIKAVDQIIDFRDTTNAVYATPRVTIALVSGRAVLYVLNGIRIQSTTTLVAGQWYHIAVVRSAGVSRMYINGIQEGASWTDATVYTVGVNRPVMGPNGADFNSTQYFTGLIGPTRISRWAVYKSNFTPSVDLFPTVQGVPAQDPYYDKNSLLLNMQGSPSSTVFVDESPNAFTVTPYGNAQLVSDATFGTVASFDGSGDYLDTPNTTALDLPGDFTIEAWVYGIGLLSTTHSCIIGKWQNPVAWALLIATNRVDLGVGNSGSYSTTYTFSTTIANGVWNHVAISRSGTSIKCFLNGSQIGSTITSSVNLSATSTTDIGRLKSNNSSYFNGLIGPLRITKGVARYTSNFTPPTGLFPTSYNTYTTLPVSGAALWLDGADSSTLFTDAGVTPVSASGDLVYQWSDKSGNNRHATQATSGNRPTWVPPASGQNGFGALSFNGTTNQLTGDQLRYTTNMSIEAVFKASSVSGTWRKIVAQSYTSGWSVNPYFSYQLGLNNGYLHCGFSVTSNYLNNGLNSTSVISANTWYHVIATFQNGVFSLYINGSLNNSVDKSSSGTTIINGVAGTLTIGNSYLGVSEFFQGVMAHLSVYPQTLSSTDVTTLYNYQKAKWGIP